MDSRSHAAPGVPPGGRVPTVSAHDARATANVAVPGLQPARPSTFAFVLAFAAIYLIWGSTYLGIRIAIETMPPFAMAGARFLIAGLFLLAVLRWRGAATPTARQWWVNGITGTFLLLGGNGLVAWAEQYVPSGITALLIGVQPLLFVLTEWAWPGGSRPTLTMAGALLLGFAGVVWLAAPWESPAEGGLHLGGAGAVLAGCVCWAVGSIYSRHSKHGADPFVAAALQMIVGGLVLLFTSLVLGDLAKWDFAAISGRSWAAFVYLLVFGSLIGFSTFVWLMRHSTPARVSTYAYVNPIVAVFLGWLILDEPVTARTLVASVVIISAVVIITVARNRQPAKSN